MFVIGGIADMDGGPHRVTAAASWFCMSHAAGLPWRESIAGMIVAAAFSAGPTSPDFDNCWLGRKLDRWLPDEWFGHGGPLKHRGILHWWFLPVVLALYLHSVGGPWYAWAGCYGWASHLAGDLVFGIKPPGIPILPWWRFVGLGLDSGGKFEHRVIPLAAVLSVGLTLYLAASTA